MTPAEPLDVLGLIGTAVVLTVLVTPLLSGLVLWRYRRAVGRFMRATAPGSAPDEGVPAADSVAGAAPPSPVVVLDATGARHHVELDGTAWRRARRRMVSTAAVYAAAGTAFGLVATLVVAVLRSPKRSSTSTRAVTVIRSRVRPSASARTTHAPVRIPLGSRHLDHVPSSAGGKRGQGSADSSARPPCRLDGRYGTGWSPREP